MGKSFLQRMKESMFGVKENFDDPWRDIWPAGNFEKLRNHYYDELSKFRPHEAVQYINVLLLGPSASGKSSFINSCSTALRQRNIVLTPAGVRRPQGTSCTHRLVAHLLKLKDSTLLPVRLYDCRGLHEQDGVLSKDVKDIIRGHIKSGYEINSENPIDKHSELYRENPGMGDSMHVIVHTASADIQPSVFADARVKEQLQEESNEWMGKVEFLNELLYEKEEFLERERIKVRDLPHVVLLTRVDRLGMSDTKKLFFNKDVKEVCDKAADESGLPLNQVFPTINYAENTHPDVFLDFLALYNLWQILIKGNVFVEDNSPTTAPEGFRS